MRIILSPQVSNDQLTLERQGSMLIVNGQSHDLSVLAAQEPDEDGQIDLPPCLTALGEADGEITVTVLFPMPAGATEAARFPAPIVDPPDGPVALPVDYDAGEMDE